MEGVYEYEVEFIDRQVEEVCQEILTSPFLTSRLQPQRNGLASRRFTHSSEIPSDTFRQALQCFVDAIPDGRRMWTVRFWFSATKNHGSIERHGHDGVWSGCLYVGADEDASPIEFLENVPAPTREDPEHTLDVWHPFATKSGKMFVWASPIEHRVVPGRKSTDDRVCLVFTAHEPGTVEGIEMAVWRSLSTNHRPMLGQGLDDDDDDDATFPGEGPGRDLEEID